MCKPPHRERSHGQPLAGLRSCAGLPSTCVPSGAAPRLNPAGRRRSRWPSARRSSCQIIGAPHARETRPRTLGRRRPRPPRPPRPRDGGLRVGQALAACKILAIEQATKAQRVRAMHAARTGGDWPMAVQRPLDAIAMLRESGRARLDGLSAAPSSPAAPAARLGAEYWGGDRPRRGRGRDNNRALRSCGIGGMVLGEARAGAHR